MNYKLKIDTDKVCSLLYMCINIVLEIASLPYLNRLDKLKETINYKKKSGHPPLSKPKLYIKRLIKKSGCPPLTKISKNVQRVIKKPGRTPLANNIIHSIFYDTPY